MESGSLEATEIAAEQAYVDTVYAALEEVTATAQNLVTEGMARGHIGHEGGLVERDAMVHQAHRRIAALNAAHDGLVFGRLDLVDDEPRYIGRIGVRDSNYDVLLLDWRAPAASLFYRATAQEPAGVIRRRVLRSHLDRIIGIEDELLDADAAPEGMPVIGEGALLASLSRARDAHMHSVIATIQAEQDEAIRAPVRGATIITGGPGTGKTVVALHRAAYLLYTDRRRFEQGGVLVVGPSGVFMDYIERVLPSLGETAVTLRSIGAVVDGIRAEEHDRPELAAVKGSAVMQKVLARLAAAPVADAPTELRYFYRDDLLVVNSRALAKLRKRLLSYGRANEVRHHISKNLLDVLYSRIYGERAAERSREEFEDDVATDDRFLEFIEQWWPVVDPVEQWETLPSRVRELAGDLLTEAQLTVLAAAEHIDPKVDDIPLIDELRYLLGEAPPTHAEDEDDPLHLMSFEREERENRPQVIGSIDDVGYAHVLVDEAQDLSPMQWRMLGRRGPTASWTIVGDLAQSSWPDPQESINARQAALGAKQVHEFRLTTNYRNSAEIYELAAQIAGKWIDSPDLADAVRRTGFEPEHRMAKPENFDGEIRRAVNDLLGQVDGSVAVVAARDELARAAAACAELAEENSRLRFIDPIATKGLEFDAVLIVEPDAIVAEAEAGWRTLYVVLTRATQRLLTLGASQNWLSAIR